MLDHFQMTKNELDKSLESSSMIMERSVALPVMVRTSKKELAEISLILHEVLEQLGSIYK